MKQKSMILILTVILTLLLYSVSTYLQRKIIKLEPKVECLFAKTTIPKNEKVNESMFFKGSIDISSVTSTKIIRNYNEIENKYANETIYKGQIAVMDAFDTKENLAIYQTEKDKEKISIKIKSAENGVSHRVKPGANVNVYITLRSDIAKGFLPESEKAFIGNEEYGYEVIKLLENKEVLDTFDIDGLSLKESDAILIDTILLAVSHEEAKQINLLREIGTFNVTLTSSSLEEIGEIENENILN